MHREVAAAMLLCCAAGAWAQLATPDPDWKESGAPPAPAFDVKRMLPLDMPRSGLSFGIDPATVSLGADGVARYVVIATSPSGAVNAIYEGIRCSASQVRIYAQYNPASGWVTQPDSAWQSLQELKNSRHSQVIARTAVCLGNTNKPSAAHIVRDLRAPADGRLN